MHFKILCSECGKSYSIDKYWHRCICGKPLEARFDLKSIKINWKSKLSHWKYKQLYPLQSDKQISCGEGGTSLIKQEGIFLKCEHLNQTGSFKDRGSAVELSKAMELGYKRIASASTGNMGASLAAYSARANLDCIIFLPESVPKEKIKQIRAYGAEIKRNGKDFNEALAQCEQWLKENDALLCGDYVWRSEGQKSIGYEIWEQAGCPDWICCPMGNGTLIYSVWKAFKELKGLKLLKKLPHMIGVQAKGCSPIVDSYQNGLKEVKPSDECETIASAISCRKPLEGYKALKALRESDGIATKLTDKEILSARKILATSGLWLEPSGAASWAGYIKLKDKLTGKGVCILTGHGFKQF